MISTLIVLLFLVHPNIVQTMFQNFRCLDINGTSRLLTDLEVVCSSGLHKFFSYIVAIPSIVVWGIGIPLFALLLLSRDKEKLDELATKEKFGFFFRGYKKHFYYWEIVIMYKKFAVIIISVFVSSIGVIAQALMLLILIIL